MERRTNRELLTIFILTLCCGIVAYIFAQLFDQSVSDVTAKRHEISELTRTAVDQYTRAEEYEAVDNYSTILNESLPSVDDIADILTQLEIIAEGTQMQIILKLEEGVIGEGAIEFTDEEDRAKFLKNLEIQEFNPTTEPEAETNTTNNVALQMVQEQPEAASDFNINYLEISVNLTGTYDNLRMFIEATRSSKYVFTIREIRINKIEDGVIDANLKVRAFIFEE